MGNFYILWERNKKNNKTFQGHTYKNRIQNKKHNTKYTKTKQ
jgi:hypothetical protein